MPAFLPTPASWRNTGHNYQFMLAWITPITFLYSSQTTMRVTPENLTTPYEATLTRDMIDGYPVDPCMLGLENAVILDTRTRHYTIKADPRVHFEKDRDGRIKHEGRNRAAIAQRLDIPFIPVMFEVPPLKNWFSGYEIYDAIWRRPDVEVKIMKYLDITRYKLDVGYDVR